MYDLHVIGWEETCLSIHLTHVPVVIQFLLQEYDVTFVERQISAEERNDNLMQVFYLFNNESLPSILLYYITTSEGQNYKYFDIQRK